MSNRIVVTNQIWSLNSAHYYDGKLPLRYVVIMWPHDHTTPEPYCAHEGYRYFHRAVKDVTVDEAERFVDNVRLDGETTKIFKDYEFMQRELENGWDALESFYSAVRRLALMSNIEEPKYIKILYKTQIG